MFCICGHDDTVHEHFRDGSDCGQCGDALCPEFVPAGHRPPVSRELVRAVLVISAVPAALGVLIAAAVLVGEWAVWALLVLGLVVGCIAWTIADRPDRRT